MVTTYPVKILDHQHPPARSNALSGRLLRPDSAQEERRDGPKVHTHRTETVAAGRRYTKYRLLRGSKQQEHSKGIFHTTAH